MGKKKGGSKNKLARMSEEERARYLQHRADMEEEARRRKQQLISLYMKNKLKREEAFTRLNLAKINQEWRSILRQVKCQALKREITEFEKLFQDAFDQKNRIIQRLLNDLDEAEDMYSNLQQSHMEGIDKIMLIQNERMDYFKNSYVEQRNAIMSEANEDFDYFREQRQKAHMSLEASYFTLEKNGEDQLQMLHDNYLNILDDIKSEMSIKLEEITKSREDNIEQLWTEHRKILNDYVAYMDSFYAEYSDLREKDEENTSKIRNYCYEVTKLTNQLTDLKLEVQNTIEEGEGQVSYLQKHRDKLNKNYFDMKKYLEKSLKTDEENFRLLGVWGHEAVDNLEKLYRKGEYIMQLAAVCRRLESEREKILPFQQNYMKSIAFEEISDGMRSPPDELKDQALENWFNMESFWNRVNRVKVDNACLKSEKIDLENENAMLKAQLKDNLTTVTIAAGPNGNINDRMFSRPCSMKVQKVVQIKMSPLKKPASSPAGGGGNHFQYKKIGVKIKRRPYTCVEANLSNAVRSQKLMARKLTTAKLDAIIW